MLVNISINFAKFDPVNYDFKIINFKYKQNVLKLINFFMNLIPKSIELASNDELKLC